MPFLPGTVVKLFDNVEANGGQALCSVDWIIGTLEWQDAVSGASSSSRGYARFQVPIDSRAVQSAAILNVIRIDEPTPDGAGGYTTTTWEYRITQLDDSKGPFVTVTASPIIEDAGRFQLRSVNGGVPSKLVAFDLLSPADVLSLVVLPAMTDAGMLGITLGTVDPVGLYSYSQSNVTPLGLIAWLEQQTQAECWLERVSGSAWTLNLGTRGSAAPNPVVHVGRNVTRVLDRTILVDDSFANRVEPSGVTASGETEPTHMGGALWDAGGTSGVGGRVLAIADPDGGLPPITADDQLNGTEALTANTPLTFATSGPVLSPVFDTTRRYLWWIEGGETLKGRDVESDTIVTLNLAQGGNVLAMGYDHSVDRLVIAYANLSTVLLVNPATPAIATTLTPSANAVSLSVVPEISRAYVSLNGAFTFVVNTSAGTGATWTSGPGGSGMRHLYHTAANRIVAYTPGATALSVWAAPAGVVVTASLAIGQAFAVAEDAGQSTMGIVATGALKWGTLTVSGTPAFSGFATMPAAPNIALSPDAVLSAGGRFYIVGNSGRYVVGWTGAAYTGAVGDLGSVLTLYALERGPTTSETSNLFAFDTINVGGNISILGIRRLALTADCSAFEHWTVQATDAANQTVTMPASGSGGPVRIPTAAGFAARINFRANASLDYLTRLTDPASVAAYGIIDAAPSTSIFGKTNYYRGGTFDEWRPDDTNRWMSGTGSGVSGRATRFRASEATPVANLACTFGATYTALATTAVIAGLGAGRKIQPGDALVFSSQIAVVTQHATADGLGTATLSFTGFSLGASSGAAVGYAQPDLGTLPNGRTDCPVLYGSGSNAWGMLAALPNIVGDAVAWVTAHLKIACYSGTPNLNKLQVRDPFATSDHTPVVPAQAGDSAAVGSVVGSTPGLVVIDRWLSQRVDLAGLPGHGVVRFTLTPAAGCVMYVISCSVILAADSLADTTNQTGVNDVYDSEGPRAIWRAGAIRLSEGSMPSVQYKVQALEDGHPFAIGATTILRDPSRGISARPRLVAVTRQGRLPNAPMVEPELEVSTVPTSLLRSLVDLQTVTQNLLQGAA